MTKGRSERPARGRRRAGEPSGREVLLRSSLKYFARHGYDGTSLRTIASDAGVDMALVARLFGSKEKLWRALIEHLDRERNQYKDEMKILAATRGSQPAKAFRGMMELFGRVSLEQPDLIGLMLQEANNPGERQNAVVEYLITPFRDDCTPIIEACVAAKKLRTHNSAVIFGIVASGVILPLLLPQLCGGTIDSREQLCVELIDESMALLIVE